MKEPKSLRPTDLNATSLLRVLVASLDDNPKSVIAASKQHQRRNPWASITLSERGRVPQKWGTHICLSLEVFGFTYFALYLRNQSTKHKWTNKNWTKRPTTTPPTPKEAMPELSGLYILNPNSVVCELLIKHM